MGFNLGCTFYLTENCTFDKKISVAKIVWASFKFGWAWASHYAGKGKNMRCFVWLLVNSKVCECKIAIKPFGLEIWYFWIGEGL